MARLHRLHLRLFGTPLPVRRLAPRGLLGRSLLILVTPMVLLQVVTAIIFYDRHWDTVARRLAEGIAGDVATVMELMTRFPDSADRNWIFTLAQTQMGLTVTESDGAILPNQQYDQPDYNMMSVLEQLLQERIDRPVVIDGSLFDRTILIRVQLSTAVLTIEMPTKRLYSSTTYIFVLWMVGTSLVLIGIATLFLTNQVRSIRRLAESAERFGKGQDVPSIKEEGAREVRQAAHAFNVMRERIQRQIAQRTEMLAGVSHDLRTPLTRMKLQLAMMPESTDSADLQEDVAEMERMVEGYLAFARGEGTETVVETDLTDLVDQLAGRFRRTHPSLQVRGLNIPPLCLPLRPTAIERALSNLLGNAARYGKTVRLSLRRRSNWVDLVVEDDGPGIPPDRREDVFRAFWRADASRNSQTGGVGLGLTIARDVARVHGGDILLGDSRALGGLEATLRLPL